MPLTRWEPVAELASLRDQFDRMFERLGGEWPFSWPASYPAVNIWEDDNNVYAETELPGLTAADVEITVTGNELGLRGARKPCEGQDVVYHRRERRDAEFSRSVTLPCDIADDKVEARMHDGVLLMTMPKAPDAKPRKIDVRIN